MEFDQLVQAAIEARTRAYSPYSRFQVGAALLGDSGRIYVGCNVESASFSPTCCAERVALFSAVAQGERDFSAIAIVGGPQGEDPKEYVSPCGVCRQALAEFCDPDRFQVILAKEARQPFRVYSLSQLFPLAFTPRSLAP